MRFTQWIFPKSILLPLNAIFLRVKYERIGGEWRTFRASLCLNAFVILRMFFSVPRSSIEQSSNLHPRDRTRKPDATIRRGSQTETRANMRRSTAKPYARSASASKSLSLLRSGKSESGNDCFVTGVGIPFRLENYIEIFAAKYCSTVRSIFSFEPCFKTVRENIIV